MPSPEELPTHIEFDSETIELVRGSLRHFSPVVQMHAADVLHREEGLDPLEVTRSIRDQLLSAIGHTGVEQVIQ